ncbi:MAG: hypothetical protein GY927_01480, partial [bacterium]|nr:hypothetical protein [bacterium]
MTKKLIQISDLIQLPVKHAVFVLEWVKDGATRRAAEASGYSHEYGAKLILDPQVSAAIDMIFARRMEEAEYDADWLLGEMVDNHYIARQQGNISASNTALSMVGKHKRVDAFAADKVNVSTDADVVDRLVMARRRMHA